MILRREISKCILQSKSLFLCRLEKAKPLQSVEGCGRAHAEYLNLEHKERREAESARECPASGIRETRNLIASILIVNHELEFLA